MTVETSAARFDAPSRRSVLILRTVTVAVGAVLLGAVHVRHRPSTLCPLRALTGVPCPFCGGTTAVADLGRGQWRDALLASPIALLLVGALPLAAVIERPAWWSEHVLRRRAIIIGVLVISEIWQLFRFHLL